MANNGSKIVTRQVENLRDAASRARDLAPAVAAVIESELEPLYEEGAPRLDIRYLQIMAGKWIEKLSSGLSDNQYERHHLRSLNRHLREQVKGVAANLRKLLTEIRFTLDVAIGKEAAASYFEGRSSLSRLTAPILERVGSKLLHLFEDPKFGWADMPARTRTTLQDLRQALADELGRLQAAFESLRPEHTALRHASGIYQREYLGKEGQLRRAVDLLQGLYRAAGFHLEADDLTPAATRRRRPDEEAPGGPEPTPGKVSSLAVELASAALAKSPAPRLSRKERKRRRRQRNRARRG